MKKLISFLAFSWAFICLLIIPVTFIGNNQFAKQLARLPFMKVNPKFTGGELERVIEKDSLKISINKPVFEALIGESSEGFVQIKFSALKNLPEIINSEIDYDKDGVIDFKVSINTLTAKTDLEAINPNVLKLDVSSKVKNDWIIRVQVKNR